MGWSSSLTKSLGSALGAAVGGYFGGPAGASAGYSFGSMLGPSEARLANREYVQQKRDAYAAWQAQNEYNSPVAQMQRLQEAGLNPMLVYSSGNVTGNSSSSIDLPNLTSTASSGASSVRNNLSPAVEKFFLDKSMENAEDQSKANELNEQYMALRNAYLLKRLEILSQLPKGNTQSEDSLSRRIKEARLKILEKQLASFGNGSIFNLNTWFDLSQAGGSSIADQVYDTSITPSRPGRPGIRWYGF